MKALVINILASIPTSIVGIFAGVGLAGAYSDFGFGNLLVTSVVVGVIMGLILTLIDRIL